MSRTGFFVTIAFALITSFSAFAEEPATMTPGSLKCEGDKSYKVSLSFDDGPAIPQTGMILDELKKRGLHATFLISGSHFKNYAKTGTPNEKEKQLLALLDRMKAEGHTIGSHSFEHINHASEDPAAVAQNLKSNDEVWTRLGLQEKNAPFRFPYGGGWFNNTGPNDVMPEVHARGFKPLHWDVDTWDWSKIKRKALPNSLLKQICSHGGGMVLMHDIEAFTAKNLGSILDSIQNSGHQIVSLADFKKTKSPVIGNWPSLADHADWIKSCGRPVGDVDGVWPSCKDYQERSTDVQGGQR